MGVVLPYVSWSTASEVVVPIDEWEQLYASFQTLKGHVQEYPGCQRFDVFVAPRDDAVEVHCYTTWDTPEQRDAYVEAGYTFERMLSDLGGVISERSLAMEKVF
jgi:heme-degrading monooxygenase HmoA